MNKNKLTIRPLHFDDFPQWFTLWQHNNMGQIQPEITTNTWERLMDEASAVNGLGAFIGDEMAGFVHYILHPVTGHIEPASYMQDLFVSTDFRKKGIGKALVEDLAKLGKQQKWARLYWLAEEKNEAAQALYSKIGLKLDFSFHVMPL